MDQPDFSKRKQFPGTHNGPFDVFLRAADSVERIPSLLFAALLFLLALIPLHNSLEQVLLLWGFFISDWALLLALPLMKKSYGPAKPPTLLLACFRLPFVLLPAPWFWGFQVLGTLLILYGFWLEPFSLRVTRQTARSPKLPAGPPLRILHIADLHLERITARERELNRRIQELQPDIIVFTGDFLNLSCVYDPQAWADVRALIQEWKAPLGSFACAGSPPVDPPQVLPHLLEGMHHLRCLHGERVTLAHNRAELDIVGLDCSHKPHVDGPKLSAILAEAPPERFTILLYHSPDLAPEAANAGVDLMLSGHTHGGQVRLPFFGALYASSLYGKQFEAGRYALGNTILYVSRGLGLEGMGAPRVRFLCPPEIILWEISGEG